MTLLHRPREHNNSRLHRDLKDPPQTTRTPQLLQRGYKQLQGQSAPRQSFVSALIRWETTEAVHWETAAAAPGARPHYEGKPGGRVCWGLSGAAGAVKATDCLGGLVGRKCSKNWVNMPGTAIKTLVLMAPFLCVT